MKHIVAGTAGHIDHGKTALVRALTGIDTDRLEEEKRRGISIDIGFAHFQPSADLRIALVDVPGHEKFIKNMLAGVGGIDVFLLVVAADSSIQPQTREHFQIARLLGIEKGLVALTKTDLVDDEVRELVRLEVEDLVKGSFLENSPIVPVSAVTGSGMKELSDALAQTAGDVHAKSTRGHFRLPVDRSFTVRGFGTVVTGTLISGSVRVDDEVEAHPTGRRMRVRGVQVHGESVESAFAGQRTALNLAGTEHLELHRGMTLAARGVFDSTQTIDCLLDLLATAQPLKYRAPVHFHAGAAEIEAEVRRLDRPGKALEAGERAYVRIKLQEPALLLPGDRFIVRKFSPVVTIGGGLVLDCSPPGRVTPERLKTLGGSETEQLRTFLRDAPFGMSLRDLIARSGRTEAAVERAMRPLLAGWFIAPERAQELFEVWKRRLASFHRENPLAAGIAKESLRGDAPSAVFDELVRANSGIVVTDDLARLASHRVELGSGEQQALSRIESAFESGGLSVPAVKEVLAASGVEPAKARSLLQMLLKNGSLVRVNDDLVFHRRAIERLLETVRSRRGQSFTVSDFKTWTGVSRKYAIPLLEMLDRQRLTRRVGENRVVN